MLMIQFQSLEVTLSQTFAYVDLVSLVLYYCKHVANPVILFVMSTEFQKAFMASLKCVLAEPRDAVLSQQPDSKSPIRTHLKTQHVQCRIMCLNLY